jgi:hypothetical protein
MIAADAAPTPPHAVFFFLSCGVESSPAVAVVYIVDESLS